MHIPGSTTWAADINDKRIINKINKRVTELLRSVQKKKTNNLTDNDWLKKSARFNKDIPIDSGTFF